jgi:hypothetical protein
MTPLALITIGILAGLLLTVNLLSIATLVYMTWQQRRDLAASQAATRRAIASSTIATDRMRQEITLALSSMDANRLHESSLTIQSNVKLLQQAIAAFSKIVFSAGAGDSMNLTPQPTDWDPNYYPQPLTPDPRPFTGTASIITDHFDQWRANAVNEAANKLGYDTPLPPASLPDIQQPDGAPLTDEERDAWLDDYTPRTNQGQPHQFDDLPGNTESGEGPTGRE